MVDVTMGGRCNSPRRDRIVFNLETEIAALCGQFATLIEQPCTFNPHPTEVAARTFRVDTDYLPAALTHALRRFETNTPGWRTVVNPVSRWARLRGEKAYHWVFFEPTQAPQGRDRERWLKGGYRF